MEAWDALRVGGGTSKTVLVGDLNIAPLEHDVWSSKQLAKVVSHTPLERRRLTEVATTGGWVDMMRALTPEPQKLYTWWSYRSPDWDAADKGRRLDHVWLSPALAPAMRQVQVLREAARLGPPVGPRAGGGDAGGVRHHHPLCCAASPEGPMASRGPFR